MNRHRIVLILGGGRGSRIQIDSHNLHPKSFFRLTDDRTMLEETYSRAVRIPGVREVMVSTEEKYGSLAERLLPVLSKSELILEPICKDTGPAIALATGVIARKYPDSTVLILPVDHRIKNLPAFWQATDRAFTVAEEPGKIAIVGIAPTRPEHQFGYLQLGSSISDEVLSVLGFMDKPDRHTAGQLLGTNAFCWDSGIFAWSNSTMYDSLQQLNPELGKIAEFAKKGLDWGHLWSSAVPITFTKSILANASNIMAVRGNFDWDDIGNYSALERYDLFGRRHSFVGGDEFMDPILQTSIAAAKTEIRCISVFA